MARDEASGAMDLKFLVHQMVSIILKSLLQIFKTKLKGVGICKKNLDFYLY